MSEGVPLAPLTTFKLGGPARELITIRSADELRSAAREASRARAFCILGGGSNLLVPDEGVAGLVIKVEVAGTNFEEAGARARLVLGAGVSWDAAVAAASERGLWGIENLAGIPGTAGGAAVQNIGAYGTELADTFEYADVFDLATGEIKRIERTAAQFAYRDSLFKHEPAWVLTQVALTLASAGEPSLAYQDLREARARGVPLGTPGEVGDAVRNIRRGKFPDLAQEGTAGSFFKNPVVEHSRAAALARQFPGLPQFPQERGVKLSLAWLLDHALGIKGLSVGGARLFEHQPLVIAAPPGASARDVEELAQKVEAKVFAEIGIRIEREVEIFTARELSTARA